MVDYDIQQWPYGLLTCSHIPIKYTRVSKYLGPAKTRHVVVDIGGENGSGGLGFVHRPSCQV